MTIGVRPEDVRPAAPGEGIKVNVDYVEELGATRLVHGRVDGQPLTVVWAAGESVPDEVWVSVAPTTVHLFDRETGQRLD